MVIWHAIFRERCCHDQLYGVVPLIYSITQLYSMSPVYACLFIYLLAFCVFVCLFVRLLFCFFLLLSFVCYPLFSISFDSMLNFPFVRAKPLNLCHCVFLTYLDYILAIVSSLSISLVRHDFYISSTVTGVIYCY